MTERCGKLSDEDLARFRMMACKRDAYRIASEKYSANDIEQNEMAYSRFMGEVAEKHNIDDSRVWGISIYTGVMVYGGWGE